MTQDIDMILRMDDLFESPLLEVRTALSADRREPFALFRLMLLTPNPTLKRATD